MSAEENMALARRLMQARVGGDLDALDEMLAPDFVSYTKLVAGQPPGREGEKWAIAQLTAALSNVSVLVEDQIAAGDKVASRFVVHETHDRAELMGVAPSGKAMTNKTIMFHRIEGGKIAEEWSIGTLGLKLRGQRLEQERIELERVEQELRVARRIQQTSFPKKVPTLEGWRISPFYEPAREVGGDFYDFHLLSEGRLGLVVGDATGKGVPAALVMSTTCGMLRLAAQGYSSPGEVLERVNEALFPNIPANMFVTCFYAILDPESGHLLYANAGHDVPYLHRNGDCEELKARGMPLGLMPAMSYEQKEIFLHAGQTALFYSDGLVEAHDPKGEMFGFPRLRGLVAGHGEERSLGEALLEELNSFVGGRGSRRTTSLYCLSIALRPEGELRSIRLLGGSVHNPGGMHVQVPTRTMCWPCASFHPQESGSRRAPCPTLPTPSSPPKSYSLTLRATRRPSPSPRSPT